MISESHCKNLFRTLECAHLPVRPNLPPRVFGENNVDGQLDLNSQVDVKPGRHVFPVHVGQLDKEIASEANQDEEPGRGLQGHAQDEGRLVSAVGRKQQGEASKGQ